MKRSAWMRTFSYFMELLVCFRVSEAPRDGQGDAGGQEAPGRARGIQGARRRPDYLRNPAKPLGDL